MTNETSTEHRQPMVLRIGHRVQRDLRVTTHVCLTARALGARGVIVSDVRDRRLIQTMDHVTSQFGGRFSIEMGKPWKKSITDWQKAGGKVTHLTAYGIPLPQIADQIREFHGDMLIVVGAEKVPSELFHLADWNVAVTNQPISEVSALGIFLDWIMEHKWLVRDFSNATLKIVPTEHGKKVLRC